MTVAARAGRRDAGEPAREPGARTRGRAVGPRPRAAGSPARSPGTVSDAAATYCRRSAVNASYALTICCTSLWRTTSRVVEVDERDALDRCRRPSSPRPGPRSRPVGRSICVMSPVITAFEPKPRRVRNIFICSDVVFCASSRMTNASFSVRPRMNAIGAISIVPRSSSALDPLDVEHVVERVVERPQVRVHLLLQIAGQEAELLARFDRRPRQDDAADLLREQERRPPAPSPGRSCRCRPGRCRTRCRAARWRRDSGAG